MSLLNRAFDEALRDPDIRRRLREAGNVATGGTAAAFAQQMDAAVTDMEQVGGGGLDDQPAEGAHVAALAVVAVLALLGLGVQPVVGSGQHLLAGFLHRPRVGGAVVVFEEAGDRRLRRLLADLAAADWRGDSGLSGDGDRQPVCQPGCRDALRQRSYQRIPHRRSARADFPPLVYR